MATVSNNILISGLRGRVGNQLIFRVVNGVTIVSRAPEKSDRRKETQAQRKTRDTFRIASQWAKAQVANPEKKQYYVRLAKTWNLTNAYTAAVKDYMCNAKGVSTTHETVALTHRRLRQKVSYKQTFQVRNTIPLIRTAAEWIPDEPASRWLRDGATDSALSAFKSYCDKYRPGCDPGFDVFSLGALGKLIPAWEDNRPLAPVTADAETS